MNDVEHHEIPFTEVADEAQRVPIFSQLAVLAAVLFLLLGASITPMLMASKEAKQPASVATNTTAPSDNPERTDQTADYFAALTIEADAAFVWDVHQQRSLFQQAPDKQLPLASITKLMTALVANELFTSTSTVTISEAAINQDGASGLRVGETFTLAALSDLLLLSSSNDGAYAIAEALGAQFDEDDPAAAFVALMNIRAEELALTQTYFRNPTGLDITAEQAGAYGSARDVAFLLEYIIRNQPEIIEATGDTAAAIRSQDGTVHTAYNTNQDVLEVAGIIGSKTGYTELAGGNLAIAFDSGVNRPVIAVVLGSSWQGRFDDVQNLMTASRRAVQ